MRSRRFIQCDVFTPTPVRGNGLAVVIDGDGISDADMLQFAAWTNLAETTFVLPPTDDTADYALRIFSPGREMRFAGHPTLGSCAAWLHCGGVPREQGVVRQQCAIGIVDIDIGNPDRFAFTAPPTEIRALPQSAFDAIAMALDLPAARILNCAELDNGPVFQVFELDGADAVLALDPARVRWPEFRAVGFIGAHVPGGECDFEVRMLAPASGLSEDPITGSLIAALAHWLQAQGRLEQAITIAQGTSIGRHGRVAVSAAADGAVWIGGQTHILIDGRLSW